MALHDRILAALDTARPKPVAIGNAVGVPLEPFDQPPIVFSYSVASAVSQLGLRDRRSGNVD